MEPPLKPLKPPSTLDVRELMRKSKANIRPRVVPTTILAAGLAELVKAGSEQILFNDGRFDSLFALFRFFTLIDITGFLCRSLMS